MSSNSHLMVRMILLPVLGKVGKLIQDLQYMLDYVIFIMFFNEPPTESLL